GAADDELDWEAKAAMRQLSQPAPSTKWPGYVPPEKVIANELQPSVRKLQSGMPMVVAAGAEELGRSNHPDAVGPLIGVLGLEQRSVRFAVFEALIALRAHSAGPLQKTAATHSDATVRALAGRILGQIKRIEQGAAPLPVEDLLVLSDGQLAEVARDMDR